MDKEIIDLAKSILKLLMTLYVGIVFGILGLRFAYMFIISQPMDQWIGVYSAVSFMISFICYRIYHTIG